MRAKETRQVQKQLENHSSLSITYRVVVVSDCERTHGHMVEPYSRYIVYSWKIPLQDDTSRLVIIRLHRVGTYLSMARA